MSHRDVICFLAGAAAACAIGGIVLWLSLVADPASPELPPWHPPTSADNGSRGSDLPALAQQMRRQRNYAAAREAYADLERRGAMNADTWADYADVVASLQNGALSGEPARLIDAALRSDPNHPKALWLQASLAHQQARYDDALEVWKRLRVRLPEGSPDHRIIAANIEEASRLARSPRAVRDVDLAVGLQLE